MSDLGKDGWPSDTTVIRGRDREIESLRKDAERYRYLRDATGWSIQQWLGLTGVWTEYLSGKNLDATIDAAMEVSHE